MKRKIFTTIFVLGQVLAFVHWGHAQQSTQNVGMHAPPAPHSTGSGQAGKVVIDGKLDDWDLSGTRLMCYDTSALRDRYSARVRLLFSVMDGKPVAVLYRAIEPGTKTPVEFRSPARTVKIDRVEQLAAADIKIVRDVTGYTLEAAVPLATVGLEPKATRLRGDIGVILSDAAGARTNQRSYFYNEATNIVMDIPDESAFHVDRWGKVVVE